MTYHATATGRRCLKPFRTESRGAGLAWAGA
jgi:hypothetical protein